MPLLKSKYMIFKVLYSLNHPELELEPSRNSDLRLPGAGAERNIFGSATLPSRPLIENITSDLKHFLLQN